MKNDVMQQEKRQMKPVINPPTDPDLYHKKNIPYPCELKTSIVINGTPCKYILDLIDGEVYATNDFATYHLFTEMFYAQKTERHPPPQNNCFECHTLATQEAFTLALDQERQRYAEGYRYIPRWVKINGMMWKEGRWVRKGADAP